MADRAAPVVVQPRLVPPCSRGVYSHGAEDADCGLLYLRCHRKSKDSLLTTRYFSGSIESSGQRTRRMPTKKMPKRNNAQTAKRNPKWFHLWRASRYDLYRPITKQATRPITPSPLNRPNSTLIVPGASVALNPSATRNEPTVKDTVATTKKFHVRELDNVFTGCFMAWANSVGG